MLSVDPKYRGRELKTVGAVTRNAREPKTVFVWEQREGKYILRAERSAYAVRDGRYRATDELKY